MKLPRDVSGDRVIKMLRGIGYAVTRQKGSHVQLHHPGPPAHSVTVPAHSNLKTGTLHGLLSDVAHRRGIPLENLVSSL